jgi:hypothetical protein
MIVDFNTLPDNARIWIYQSNRPFNEAEKTEISSKLSQFLSQWTAHGSDLQAGFIIEHNRFIVIGLNQDSSYATGCSIDASVHFIQQLEQAYQVDLLDKMNVTYKQGEHIAYKPLIDFKKMAKEKAVGPNTIVFNNLVNNIGEFKEFWEVPAKDSWHNRFF